MLGLLLWQSAAVIFGLINIPFDHQVAIDVASTIFLAGLSMSALVYLITERVMRPVMAQAFADAVPERPTGIGVLPRILLTWGFCTGVPLLGIAFAHLDRPTAALPVAATYFLVASGLVVGLLGMVFAAKSIAEPLAGVRAGMAHVEQGHVDARVPVDDASEIGMLQAGFNQMVDGLRERKELADLFGRHVGVDVAREALERGVRFGGETRHAAVLFVDVVGSTALAANRPAEEVVERLNEFFTVVVNVIERYGGWVNKFEGDAALCVFGVPNEIPNADANALAAARTLRERLRNLAGLDAAIGVAAGTVIAGNVGAEARYEYTVIGDPVNEAARLTELAKARPERLIASADVVDAAGPDEAKHWVIDGEVTLRGRGQPTRLAMPAS
ncbi:MAG: adenylate cyclase [Frankiales bacterium]|nr:adenylate cyclase [Frankiales bacterium]